MEMLLFECFHLMYTNNGMGEDRKQCMLRAHPTHVKKEFCFCLSLVKRFANAREFFKELRLRYVSQVVKMSLCLIKRHSIKSCGGMEV